MDGKDIDIVNYARRSQGTEVGCCESKDSSDTCQTDACKSNKCENNATCVPSKYAGFTCDCKGNKAASWTGRYCQTKGIIIIYTNSIRFFQLESPTRRLSLGYS